MLPSLRKGMDNEIGSYIRGLTYDGAEGNPETYVNAGSTAYDNILSNRGGRDSVTEAILEAATRLQETDLMDADTVVGSYETEWVLVVRARLFKALLQNMLERDFHWDQLSSQVLDSLSVRGNERWMGRLFGINIMTHNSIPEEASGSPHTAYLINKGAVTMAQKTGVSQSWDPSNNPSDEIGYLFRQLIRYGRQLVDPRFIKRVTIGSAKS